MSAFPLHLEPDSDGSLLVTAPALPEVTTFAADAVEAEQRGRDAVEEALAARIARGEDIPAPASVRLAGQGYARLSLQTAAKVSLYRSLRAHGLTRADLQRRMGCHREQVDRLFRLDHASRLDQLEAAFAALGEDITIAVTPAERAALERGERVLA